MAWLRTSGGTTACVYLRVLLHGLRRCPIAVGSLCPCLGEETCFYRNVGNGKMAFIAVHDPSNSSGAQESWAITYRWGSYRNLWQYAQIQSRRIILG